MRNRQITTLILLAVSSIIITGTVYAEEAKVNVPFEWDKHGCTLFKHSDRVLYQCYFEGPLGTPVDSDAKVFPEGEFGNGTSTGNNNGTSQDTDTDIPKTPTEKLIEKLEIEKEQNTIHPVDEELLKLLKTLNEKCYFGIEEGLPIQDFGQFLLPDRDPRISLYNKALDLNSYPKLLEIMQLLEACEGWTKYKGEHLTRYLNIETDSFLPEDVTTHAWTAEDIEPYIFPKFSNHMLLMTEKNAQNSICHNNYYGDNYKKQQGCIIEYGHKLLNYTDTRELSDIQKEMHMKAGDICNPKYNFPMAYRLDMGCQLIVDERYQPEPHSITPMAENEVFNDWFYYNQDPVSNDHKQLEKVKRANLNKYMERHR